MPEIADLRELMEAYRRKSRSVGWQPVAAAYADAADQIEETIAEIKAASPPVRHPA
jgi:cytochrome c551/c552